jgi:hypothetical protein
MERDGWVKRRQGMMYPSHISSASAVRMKEVDGGCTDNSPTPKTVG